MMSDMAVGPSSSHQHRRLQSSTSNNGNSVVNSNNINNHNNMSGTRSKSSKSSTNDIILGLRNDSRYRDIMYQQFNILGTKRNAAREEKVAFEIFTLFHREGAQFYRMERDGQRLRIDDEEALKRITRQIKRRTESTHIWLGKSNHDNNNDNCRQEETSAMSSSQSSESNQIGMQRDYDQHTHSSKRRRLHKEHLPTQSTMNMPQDPIFNGNQSSNHESPFEFHAEEKKQDDDPIDLELRSSSAARSNDRRGAQHFCSAGQSSRAVHNHGTEMSGSEVMQDSHRSNNYQYDEASSASKATPSMTKVIPPSDRIILSLNDEYYKEIMWKHYRILGKTRDGAREVRIGNDIFTIFKQTMGRNGRFFKRAQDQDFEVDDETALAKIIADIRRRMKNYPKWSGSPQKHAVKAQQSTNSSTSVGKMPSLSPRQLRRETRTEVAALRNENIDSTTTVRKRSTRTSTSSDPARNIPKPSKNDIILCLSNDQYKEVMVRYYNILGSKQGGGKFKEENVVHQIFQSLKKSMGKGVRFFMKMSPDDLLHPVDDDIALQTITRDIKRRNEVMDYWLSGGVGAPYPDEPFLHANTAPVSLPIAQHHAWRDQLSASPIEVTGNDDSSVPTPPRVNTHSVDMLLSEPPLPKSSFSSSPRQPIDDNGPYQLCPFGEKAIEEYFEQVGKRVVEDAQSNEAYNIFADAVPTTQDRLSVLDQSESRLKHVTAKVSIPSDHKSNFLRHFQCNEARLAELQRNIGSEKGSKLSAMQLSSAIKRVKVGSKDRVLCMVVDCEKHAQTRCSGCCTAHFRLLNSPAGNDKKQLLPAIENGELDKFRSKETLTETLPPEQLRSLQGDTTSGAQVDNECIDEECRELIVNQSHIATKSIDEITSTDTFRNSTPTIPSTQQTLPDSNSKTSAQRSMITISPITTKQCGEEVPNPGTALQNHAQQRQGFAPTSTSLDCLDYPGTEGSIRNMAQSPKGVQAVNSTLHPKSSPGGKSAFSSPTRVVRPPLFHQLYRPSETSPNRVHFPGLRSASAVRLKRNCGCDAEQPHSPTTCRQATAEVGVKMSDESVGVGKDVSTKRKSKRIMQSVSPNEDLNSAHSLPRSRIDQSKSALCHCPICSKGNLSVQGMYAHYGRAHNGTLPWQKVTFSCPFCSTAPVSRFRYFESFGDLEAHVNAKHPRCEVIGPHPSRLSASLNNNHSSSTKVANPNNVRVLRERKAAPPDGISDSSGQYQLHTKDPKVVATTPPIQSWSKLEYPHYNSKDIVLIEEQCRSQEEIVEAAREQRVKICRNEAEMESKTFDEERLAYQRGIRERTRLADGERIEKQKFTEKADQLMMLYQYENRNRKRSREEVEFDKLCARSVVFSTETTWPMTREGKSCTDDQCQFCKVDSEQLRHLILDSENEDRKKEQTPVEVLLPSYRIVNDIFSLNADSGTKEGVSVDAVASAEIKSAKSRRDVSTAKRVKIEEDKLLMLKNTKHCLEFIKKYNGGMILNAWGGTRKEYKYKKRKTTS